ncbi:MAG: phosphate/phosphite/phosphonate ABC transporter substrate-binding protein [Burkholderiales bacterium]|nr:phosphate/phosphite/phosphonate ABC transporter substrate-binding protein [Burkholderiales bacterium]
MRRFAFSLFTLFCQFTGVAMVNAAEPAQAPLILAVHPYLPSAEIQQRFAPLAEYLGQQLGRQVQVRVGRDYEQHIDAVGLNSVDIAFMGPASYVKLTARYGAKPLLARIEIKGKPILSGYIITSVNSALHNLTDLRGKRFAFVDPDSTMGTIVPRYVMQQAGVGLNHLGAYQHLGGHKDVALGVLNGDYDAGAVKSEVYDELAPRGLRVLIKLPDVSEHLFVTRADLPAKQIKLLRQALLQLKSAPNGAAILRAINKDMTAMAPVADADYNSLRKLQRAVEVKPG